MWTAAAVLLLCLELSGLGRTDKCAGDTFTSDIPATTKCLEDCWFGNLQQHFPQLYNRTGWRRDPPRDPRASAFCAEDTSGVNQSGINVHWGLPHSYGAAGVEGYELRVEGDLKDYRCLVIDLDAKVTQHNKHSMFNATFFPLRRSSHFKVVFHSLPRANDSVVVTLGVVTDKCDRGDASSNWSPGRVNESYSAHEKILTVWFPAPPQQFNITEYKLWLIPLPMDVRRYRETIANSTLVQLTDIDHGKYKLVMQPYDRHAHDDSLCICRDDTGRCESCKQTMWPIEISPPRGEKTAAGSSRTLVPVTVAGGTLFFLLLLLILYRVLARRYGISIDIEQCKRGKNCHLVVVDACTDKCNAAKLRDLLKQISDSPYKLTQHRIAYDENIRENLRNHRLASDGGQLERVCCRLFQFRVLVCMLIDEPAGANCCRKIEEVKTSFPENELATNFIVISFNVECASVDTEGVKSYNFYTNAQKIKKRVHDFITGNEVIPVLYTKCTDTNQKVNQLHDKPYVRLPRAVPNKTEDRPTECHIGDDGSVEDVVMSYSPDAAGFKVKSSPLLIPQMQRERMVSNDSGRGDSESSFKQHYISDVTTADDVANCVTPMCTEFYPLLSCNHTIDTALNSKSRQLYHTEDDQVIIRNDCESEKEPCPSCNFSFYPPSVISESDMLSRDCVIDELDDGGCYHRNDSGRTELHFNKTYHFCDKVCTPFGNSMESLADKMAQINARYAANSRTTPAEVQSILEGHI